ncbi:hypothetical protein ABZT04_07155 [Streptomyces sp. NPDC005492]
MSTVSRASISDHMAGAAAQVAHAVADAAAGPNGPARGTPPMACREAGP